MFPIRDTIQSRTYPVVNTTIIVVNVLVYFIEMAQGENLRKFLFIYGLVPVRYTVPQISQYFSSFHQAFSFLSFMFLHGSFWHLFGNMWSLYIFGDNVEDRLGPIRYLIFYLLCGIGSGLSHLLINFHSQIPTIGASGAIAGVMGAYFVLYPRSRVLTLIPIFFIPLFVEIPAYYFLGIWFLLQFISAAGTPAHGGGIAWWAHIGGFLLGIALLKLLLKAPEIGLSERLKEKATKQKTHRLQVIRTTSRPDNTNLYGIITVTPEEARFGTKKLVNIPWGFHKRLFIVHVPPGVKDGTLLRLSGMGRQANSEKRGDLFLRVKVQ
ncbi:MAG: rhomboid family intramembrane serine protease [Deltaproteobacteria bacterium]|nr:rhomboid family intramembrane serine protease [Deltaproteobacteria bacterium]MBW2083785.1 rhomboid family intramembrane serine protease [Deltaproteobacteria bacterium]